MKHTPGPWHSFITTGNYMYGVQTETPRGKVITVCRIASGALTREHDARLIAAAPELLNALQMLLAKAEHIYSALYYAEPSSKNDVTFNAARAAIAQATQP